MATHHAEITIQYTVQFDDNGEDDLNDQAFEALQDRGVSLWMGDFDDGLRVDDAKVTAVVPQ